MEIIDKRYFSEYTDQIGHEIEFLKSSFDFSDQHVDVGYSTQASAVYSSSKISTPTKYARSLINKACNFF